MGDAAGSCWTRPQNRFDLFRGQWPAPDAARLSVAAELTAQCFGPDVCRSAWAPSTTKTDAAWCALFAAFSERHGFEPLPLHPLVTVRWLDHLSDYLSGSSVNLALCALLAWSKLNNLVDPLPLSSSSRQKTTVTWLHAYLRCL